jgi:peptidoglycan/LPS O-acetylase OafA/YrhL
MSAKRNFGLDFARALAITVVFFSHAFTALQFLGVGVDLFFLLSGFLIGRIYLRSQAAGTFTFWSFWQARWWRTLPPYFAALLIAYLIGIFAPHDAAMHQFNWYYLVFLQNYLGIFGLSVTWSLCVEEHFYLALPFLGGAVESILGRRSFVWVLPVAALIPQVLRTWFLVHNGLSSSWFWMTHFHCEGLILGVFLAYIYVDHPTLWKRGRPIAFAASLIPLLLLATIKLHPTSSMKLHGAIFLYWAIGFAGWTRILYDLKWHPSTAVGSFIKNCIHGIALSSYSIYLLHTLFFSDIRTFITSWSRGPIKSFTVFAISFVLCIAFYFLVERPTIAMRDKYLSRKRPDLDNRPPGKKGDAVLSVAPQGGIAIPQDGTAKPLALEMPRLVSSTI